MPSKLTRADVQRIAGLARLTLTEADVELFTTQLAGILDYAADVQGVNTDGVPPTSHAHVSVAWRDDVVVPSLDREAALANAPDADHAAGLFKVPKVL